MTVRRCAPGTRRRYEASRPGTFSRRPFGCRGSSRRQYTAHVAAHSTPARSPPPSARTLRARCIGSTTSTGRAKSIIVLALRLVSAGRARIRSILIDTATKSNPVSAAAAPTTATANSDHGAVNTPRPFDYFPRGRHGCCRAPGAASLMMPCQSVRRPLGRPWTALQAWLPLVRADRTVQAPAQGLVAVGARTGRI